MFNDVQIAKVNKIGKTVDWSRASDPKNTNASKQHNPKNPFIPAWAMNAEESTDKQIRQECVFGSTTSRARVVECTSPPHDAQDGSRAMVSPFPTGTTSSDCAQKDNNESDNNISSCSTLDIGHKVENLSKTELEIQVKQLFQRLQTTEQQRNELQHKYNECADEKELCYRRLEVMSAAHESRITEMHCVIAELSKKLRNKQETTIVEETEAEGSEISYQEESVYNSEHHLSNPDAECQTDPPDENCSLGELGKDESYYSDVGKEMRIYNETVAKSKVEALQEEVLHLKAQVALLQSEIAENSQRALDAHKPQQLEETTQDLKDDEQQHMKMGDTLAGQTLLQSPSDNNDSVNYNVKQVADALSDCEEKMANVVPCATFIMPKTAQKVSLNRSQVLSPDAKASNFPPSSADNNDCLENYKTTDFWKSFDPDNDPTQAQRTIEQLKAENLVLTHTFNECKEHCDQLYLLCGKYESNAIALQLAVNCSDRAIEAYDVMLALLESKLALMKDRSDAAEDSRKSVEAVARQLLERLESEKDICENSLGPWKNSFNFTGKNVKPWTHEDDNRLRYHASRLKGLRSTLQNTIVNLESPFSFLNEKMRLMLEECKDFSEEKKTQLDLEGAVHLQELLALREENTQLKQKSEEADRERRYAMEKITALQQDLQQMQNQFLMQSDGLFSPSSSSHNKEKELFSESDHAALTERQLVEALTRESELKSRIQTLLASVSVDKKNSNEKYEEVQHNIKDLQKMNMQLTQMLEYNKRKYNSRIRKLEQKIADMNAEQILQKNAEKTSHTLSETARSSRKHKPHYMGGGEVVPETVL